MTNVLIFFVLPVVTIIFAIVLQRILKCPALVAATFFAIFLILAFTVFDTDFIIIGIILTILAFIVAFISELICRIRRKVRECCDCDNGCNNRRNCDFNDWVCDILGRTSNNSRCRCNNRNNCRCGNNNNVLELNDVAALSESVNNLNSILTASANSNNCGNGVLTANSDESFNNNSNCNCNCNNNDNNSQNVILNAEFTPNSNNNGTTGSFRGCYRRRFF